MTTTPAAGQWNRNRYHSPVAMNLRLPEELASALRELSETTGRSQQDLAREALEEYVRDYQRRAYPKDIRHLVTPAQHSAGPPDPEVLSLLRSIGRDRLRAGLEETKSDKI